MRRLENGPRAAGIHRVEWNGRMGNGAVASRGVYWLRIKAGSQERTLRLVVAR